MSWKQKIEAQLAICQDDELAWSIVQALLDVAVAAEVANRGHWSVDGHFDGDPSAEPYFAVLNRALDKLREDRI